jgi:hypothetical protein
MSTDDASGDSIRLDPDVDRVTTPTRDARGRTERQTADYWSMRRTMGTLS